MSGCPLTATDTGREIAQRRFISGAKRAIWLSTLVILPILWGCGGGSDSGSPQPSAQQPPRPAADNLLGIDDQNAALVLETAVAIAQLTARLARTSLSSTVFLAAQRSSRLERNCSDVSSGTLVHQLHDADGDGELSATDTVSTTYNDCNRLAIGASDIQFATGRVEFDLTEFVISPTGDEYFSGTQELVRPLKVVGYTPSPIRPGRIDTVGGFSLAGTIRTNYRETSALESLTVETGSSDGLRISDSRFRDEASNLSLHRETRFASYVLNFAFRIRSESLEGTFECAADDLEGWPPRKPTAGRLVCTGAGGSAAELLGGEDAWTIAVDRAGDGNFNELERTESWPFEDIHNLYQRVSKATVTHSEEHPSLEVEHSTALNAADAAYSTSTGSVYVANDDGITVWNPNTLEVDRTVALADGPSTIALSPDGETLYIGFADAGVVKAMDLKSFAVSEGIELGNYRDGEPLLAKDIEPVRDGSGKLAIAMQTGVAVYDDGVRLEDAVDWIDRIGYVGDSLYGFRNQSSDYTLYELEINNTGVIAIDSLRNFLDGYDTDFFDANSLIVGSTGRLVDFPAQSMLGEMNGGFQYRGSLQRDQVGLGVKGVYDPVSGQFHFLRQEYLITYDEDRLVPTSVYRSPLSDVPVALIPLDNRFLLLSASELVVLDRSRIESHDLRGCDSGTWTDLSYFYDSTGRQYTCRMNHAIYDSTRHKVFASMPSDIGVNGNSIAVMDPETGAIERFIPVGSEPGRIAMTAGDLELVIAYGRRNALGKLDLGSDQVSTHGNFVNASKRPEFAGDVAASPFDAAHWLASIGNFRHLYFFDSGIRAPQRNLGHSRYFTMAFSPLEPTIAFALDHHRLEKIELGQDGIMSVEEIDGAVRGSRLVVADGWMYTDAGQKVNPETLAVELEFDIGDGGALLSVDSQESHIYFFLARDVMVFDTRSGEHLATYPIPASIPNYATYKAFLADIPGRLLFAFDDTLLILPKSDILD